MTDYSLLLDAIEYEQHGPIDAWENPDGEWPDVIHAVVNTAPDGTETYTCITPCPACGTIIEEIDMDAVYQLPVAPYRAMCEAKRVNQGAIYTVRPCGHRLKREANVQP